MGRLREAATLGQHCPQLTRRPGKVKAKCSPRPNDVPVVPNGLLCVPENNPVPAPRPAPNPVPPKALPPPPRVPAPAAAGCPKLPNAGVDEDVAVDPKPPKLRGAGFGAAAAVPKPPNAGAAADVAAPKAGAADVAAPKVGAATVDVVGPKLKAAKRSKTSKVTLLFDLIY